MSLSFEVHHVRHQDQGHPGGGPRSSSRLERVRGERERDATKTFAAALSGRALSQSTFSIPIFRHEYQIMCI